MKRNYFVLLLIVGTLLSCSNASSDPVSEDSQEDKTKIVEMSLVSPVHIQGDATWTIEERMEHYGVPGVSITVINDGKIAWSKSYGVMDKESGAPVTKETLFQAASISKPVSAYSMLRLVESDSVDLHEDINTYLSSWTLPNNEFTENRKVVVENLLNHTGGTTVHGFLGYSPDLPVPTLVEVLDGLSPANSGPIRVDKVPGESTRYSGGGYTVMQQMMIDVTGKPYPRLMADLVLDPLGMNNSTYEQPLQGAELKMAATGYLPDHRMVKGKRHTYPEMAAAGLWTTSEDLAKFAINIQRTFAGESELVLSQALTVQMLTPVVDDFAGLGIFLKHRKDEVYFGHGGWNEGFSSELLAHRDKGYGVVILTNSNHPDFISELIRSVALSYEWDEYVPQYERLELDPALLAEAEGRYRISGNRLIEVYRENDLFYSKELGEEGSELIRISDSSYVKRVWHELIQFRPDEESGKLNMLFIDPADARIISTHRKLESDEKIAFEILMEGDLERSLEAYRALMEQDPNDRTVNENNLNYLGYELLGKEKIKLAQDLFRVNMILYPNSSNVYDSYAEASMILGDIDLAIENYEKSYSLDPNNVNARETVKRLREEKEE